MNLVGVNLLDGIFEDFFQVIAVGRLVGTGVMPERLESVRHPLIVLVALFPIPGFRQFMIKGFGKHGSAHVHIHLHAELMHDGGGAFGLLHVGALIFPAEALVEINPSVADAGIGHALEIVRIAHLLVTAGFVVEVVAAAHQEIQRFVGQPGDALVQFIFLFRPDFPAGLHRGVFLRRQGNGPGQNGKSQKNSGNGDSPDESAGFHESRDSSRGRV